jgi:hypothetical protein
LICPSHLILCALINLTISAPSIKLSISMLFRILRTLSILTGPNIFLNIYFYKYIAEILAEKISFLKTPVW